MLWIYVYLIIGGSIALGDVLFDNRGIAWKDRIASALLMGLFWPVAFMLILFGKDE